MRRRTFAHPLPPLVLLAAATIGGTATASAAGSEVWPVALAGTAILLVMMLAVGLTRPLVAAAALALAMVAFARYEEVSTREPPFGGLEGTHAFEGLVAADPVPRGRFGTLHLAVDRLDGAPSEGALRVRYVLGLTPLLEGDRLSVRGSLEPLEERARGIDGEIAFPDDLRVLARDEGATVARALRALRRGVIGNIERSLPEPESSLAVGMLIGRQGRLPDDLAEALRATGTTHLVVASGQNVALFLGLLVSGLGAFFSRRVASTVALALLPAYVVLLGAEPPIVRAALMAVGITLGGALGRRTPGWLYLLFALAVMLAADPTLVDDLSFQLSATATAGVILVAPVLAETATRLLRAPSTGLLAATIEAWATATGALAAVLPVQAAAFGSMPIAAIPANVLAAPLYLATLFVAQATALLGWHDAIADLAWSTAVVAPRLFVDAMELIARAGATEVPSNQPMLLAAGWYLVIAAVAWLLHDPDPLRLEARNSSRALLPLAAGLILFGGWAVRGDPVGPSVTILDVGQGLAVLVREGDRAVMVDAGPPDGSAMRALPRGTPRTLEALVVTHADLDHAGGTLEVQRRLRVAGTLGNAPQLVEARSLDLGQRLVVGPHTSIEVLSPPRGRIGERESENDRSVVLIVALGERRILLTADIEAVGERWLIASGQRLEADALVVPHHGSRSSSTPAFIEAVSPSIAVVSAGANNQFGHPHPEVVRRYEDAGIRLLSTAEHGSVTLTLRGGDTLAVRSVR